VCPLIFSFWVWVQRPSPSTLRPISFARGLPESFPVHRNNSGTRSARPACPIITTSDQPNRFFFTNHFPTNYTTVSLCNHVIIMKKKKKSWLLPVPPYPDEIYTFHQENRLFLLYSPGSNPPPFFRF
jgi:hypothetical protein